MPTKNFEWIVTPEAGVKQIPEVRKTLQAWAERRGYLITRIWYCLEEKHQLIERVRVDYEVKR